MIVFQLCPSQLFTCVYGVEFSCAFTFPSSIRLSLIVGFVLNSNAVNATKAATAIRFQ